MSGSGVWERVLSFYRRRVGSRVAVTGFSLIKP